jgi:hypothetical protein
MGGQTCSEKNSDTILNWKQGGMIPEHAKDLLQHKIKVIEIMSTVRRTMVLVEAFAYQRR